MTFDTCAQEFNNLFKTFEDKVNFLANAKNDSSYLESTELSPVREMIQFFVKNASVTETRREQQKVLMPIVMQISKIQDEKHLIEFFKNDDRLFALFCITYVTFLFEESVKKHIDTYHKEIVIGLNKAVDILIKK